MCKTSIILLAAALPMAVNAANTEFSYGGFIKFNASYSEYSDGDVDANARIRDFNIPSQIPTSAGNGESSTSFDSDIKTSRFNFKTVTDLPEVGKVTAFIELDFIGSGGNELVSNSYGPRVRHAFIKTGHWTFGQTWSTFMNVGALSESVDFVGVTEGTVFNRQSMIRYTNGNLQLALENPETNIAGFGATDDSGLPDVVVRYNIKKGPADIVVAGIARQLALQVSDADDDASNGNQSIDETEIGLGFNVSGKVMVGKDDIKFSYSGGNIARYVGLSAAADAQFIDGEIEATDVSAWFVAFRHHWSDKLRSSITYSSLTADYEDDDLAGFSDTEEATSASINLMYSPAKPLTYGIEYRHATHELTNGNEGDLDRLQFTTVYKF